MESSATLLYKPQSIQTLTKHFTSVVATIVTRVCGCPTNARICRGSKFIVTNREAF